MISSSTLGAATTRSFNVCGSSPSSSKLRNAHFINHPYNSWVIILTVVAFGWTRGRWRPLRPGHNPQPSKNSNASWDSPTPTAASYRTTVPLPINSRTYSATSPSLAIKLALEEWRHWLERAKNPFTVRTDHKNLQYLREAKRLNPRQALRHYSSPASIARSPITQVPKTSKPMPYHDFMLLRR